MYELHVNIIHLTLRYTWLARTKPTKGALFLTIYFIHFQ